VVDPRYSSKPVESDYRPPIDTGSIWRRYSYLFFAAVGVIFVLWSGELAGSVSPVSNDPANAFLSIQVANRWYEAFRTLGFMSFGYSIAIYLANAIRANRS